MPQLNNIEAKMIPKLHLGGLRGCCRIQYGSEDDLMRPISEDEKRKRREEKTREDK